MSRASNSPPDAAAIVDSGSTNTAGYKIEVRSDGTATLNLQNRMGVAQSETKNFNLPVAVTKKFFADVKAARDGKAEGVPCMKSASFGTTTRVEWHGWTSPDLDCPPEGALMTALAHDVGIIRAASGLDAMPRRGIFPGGPPHVMIPIESPSPKPSSS